MGKKLRNGTRPDNVEMASAGEKRGHVNPIDVLVDENKRELEEPPTVVTASEKGSKPSTQSGQTDADAVLEDVERRKQERRDKKPLWYCKWISNWTKLSFFMALFCHILFMVTTAVLFATGYDILPITFDRLPLDIKDDVDFLRDMAWNNRDDEENTILITRGLSSSEESRTQPERSEFSEALEVYFEMKGGNVFTKENLQTIQQVEEEYFNNAEFQQKFCQLNSINSCVKSRSVLRYFDGTYGLQYTDPGFDNIVDIMYRANTDPQLNQNLQYHLGKDHVITATEASSAITRSTLFLGMPLAGYQNTSDKITEQEDKVKDFMLDQFKPLGDKYFEKGAGKMEFFYNSISLLSVTITSLVMKDMALAIGSLVFIILFIYIQVGSLWVALFAVFSIITSFLCSNLIYRIVLDYRYFGIFHVLALFIILGIGADDIFVFMDTWKETAHYKYKSLGHRMSDCYRKASMAMLFTSLTTAQAFIVSATSPFLGIGSFGLFAGILVCVNYISVIVFFPTVVVMYHKYFEKYKCCCCCVKPGYGDVEVAPESSTGQSTNKQRKNLIVRFFRNKYFKFVTNKVARWFILIFFAALTAVAIYYATTLKVNEEQLKFLKDSTNFGQVLAKSSAEFGSRGGDETLRVQVVWGLKPQDISSCHHTDVKCTGNTVWDDTFDMNDAGAQQALMDFCNTIRSLPEDKIAELAIEKGLNGGLPEVDCYIETMDVFMKEEQIRSVAGVARYPANTDLSVPITAAKTNTIMNTNNVIYSTNWASGFEHNFEIAMSFWLYNGFQPGVGLGSQMFMYGKLLGEGKNSPFTVEKTIGTGPTAFTYQYGTKLMYAAITINTTVIGSTTGYPTGLPIRDSWEEFISNEVSKMPNGLKGGFQIGNFWWHWFKVQEKLTSSAVVGIAIGLGVALPLLILATSNVIIGLLATLTLMCITTCVVAMIPIAGWKLGMLESLNLVLVVGLSVDYVVHLAEGYSRSAHNDRLGRTRDALEEVGISVLSGATTTLGASLFLLFAQILFFIEFGVFMFCTILCSILYALGFFITLIALIGPQNEFGSLKPFYRWCARKCCCKKSSDETK